MEHALSWSVPLTVLGIAGGVIAMALVLRNWVGRPRKRRRPLPSDPGFPVAPKGAPYRGPH